MNSCYKLLERLFLIDVNLSEDEEHVFGYLWRCRVPSKVLAFAWTLLLDCIPTTVKLGIRGVLNADASKTCVFCGRLEETALHLFLSCEVVTRLWQKVMQWLQFNFITPHNLWAHFLCWSNTASTKKLRHGFRLIWSAMVWAILEEKE